MFTYVHANEHKVTRTLSLIRRSSKKHSFLDAGTSIICENTSVCNSSSIDHHIVKSVGACILAIVVRDVVELCERCVARYCELLVAAEKQRPRTAI